MKTLRHIKIQETGNRYRIRREDDRHSIPEMRLRGKWLKSRQTPACGSTRTR